MQQKPGPKVAIWPEERNGNVPSDYRARLYDAYVTTHYRDVRAATPEARARLVPHFRHRFGRHLPADRRAAILEIGCGSGAFLSFLHGQGYRHLTGVDLSPQQVDLASALGLADVVQEDAVSFLRDRPGRFDLICGLDVLEHVPKPDLLDLLDGVRAALRPGGRFIAQTSNADSPFAGRFRYGDLTHELSFTASSIRQALRAAGFARINVYPLEPPRHNAPSLARWAAWRVIRALLTAYLAAETGILRGHLLTQTLIAVADA